MTSTSGEMIDLKVCEQAENRDGRSLAGGSGRSRDPREKGNCKGGRISGPSPSRARTVCTFRRVQGEVQGPALPGEASISFIGTFRACTCRGRGFSPGASA